MLRTRILTALVLVPLVLAAVFLLSPRAWGGVATVVIALAASEWARLARFSPGGSRAFTAAVVLSALVLLLVPQGDFARGWPSGVVLPVCGIASVFWVFVAPLWLRRQWHARAAGAAVAGWIVLVPAWMAIVQLQARSAATLLAAMAIVWIADTAAYFTGRSLGRHKLAPTISPGKTWEGVAGGLAGVAVYAAVLALIADWALAPTPLAAVAWVAAAVGVAAVSVLGDLFESLMKRQAGVKDSGSLLPGHGGILDRIDALVAAMPLVAVLAECAWR